MKRYVLIIITIVYGIFPLFSQIIKVPSDQPSIQAGIDYATDGDTVLVADSAYFENINFKGKAITVASQFLMDGDTSHISKTIIDGSQPVHPDTASTVLMISGEDSTSVLCGFTITGGTGTIVDIKYLPPSYAAVQTGGGILVIDGGCKIEHNIIRDIHMDFTIETYGGGISCYFASNELTDRKNIIIQNNSIIENYLVSADNALGAGLYISVESAVSEYTGNIIIQDNLISHNSSAANGTSMAGGIGIFMVVPTMNGEFLIRNNVITHNEVHSGNYNEGGGIFVSFWGTGADSNSSPIIYNNIIADNYSQTHGGGIGVYAFSSLQKPDISPKPVLINNTLINNSATIGPGLWTSKASPLLLNNIFWNNSTPVKWELSGMPIANIKYNIIRGYEDQTGGSNLNYEPMLTGDSFELSEGSPGIGNGTDSIEFSSEWYYAPSMDFNGNPRPHPIDARVDIGAIESSYEGFVYIPDTAFLYALIDVGVDINNDSLISYEEAEAIGSLNVSERDISDMTGIAAFINLDTLDCSKNSLTSLDVSKNTALKVLDLSTNELTSLDVSNNTLLDDLNCSACLLTSLDVSNNALLEWLSCWNNELSTLDISFNTALIGLYTQDNPITILDVSNNTALNYLRCRGNLLTRLDVSNNISLKALSVDEMPTLTCVSVWELPFPPAGVEVDTTASPNVVFTTEYCPSVGIEDYSQNGLSIYPNPTNDLLTIETDKPGHYSIEINSLNGQLMYSTKMERTSRQIDLSSFQKGVYIITIRSKEFITNKKIIKL